MIISEKINTDTPDGKRLEEEHRQYPEVVEFEHSSVTTDVIPEGILPLKDGFNQVREHIKTVYKIKLAKD